MKRTCIAASVLVLLAAWLPAQAGQYETKRGNALFTVTSNTRAKGVLQLEAELKPRNFVRIDRVYLVTPSRKKLKPSDKTTFAEQKIKAGEGEKGQVELADQKTSGTYAADAYLFEIPEDEAGRKGGWFFYAQGAGKRGESDGFRVQIPDKDIEAVLKGEAVPAAR